MYTLLSCIEGWQDLTFILKCDLCGEEVWIQRMGPIDTGDISLLRPLTELQWESYHPWFLCSMFPRDSIVDGELVRDDPELLALPEDTGERSVPPDDSRE